jgi:RecA-family ATPase
VNFNEHPDEAPPSLLQGMVNGEWLDRQDFPPLEWAVEGIVPEGFGLLVAPPKAGKSWMVAAIGLACATGGYAFGKIPVKQRPVLYLALEDGHRRLQDRFRTIMEGAPLPAAINVMVCARTHEIPGIIAEYLSLHQGKKPFIILDTLGKARPQRRPGDDPYIADYQIGSRLKDLIDAEPGASLLCVHHTRKQESADFVDAVSGTQGIAGSADFVLVLTRKRKSSEALLSVTGRDIEENEYALTTTAGRWTLEGDTLNAAAQAAETRRERDKLGDRALEVLAFVNRRTETRAADLAELGIDAHQARTYLSRLAEAGRIRKAGRGLYKGVASVASVAFDESPQATPTSADDENATDATLATPLFTDDEATK